jgi:lipoate-protein ligase A
MEGARDPQVNMAIDEALMKMRPWKGIDILRVYMWSPSGVSIGRAQDATNSVDLDEIGKKGFKLVRRPTGGGALLHQEGMEVTYGVVLSSDNPLAKLMVDESAARISNGIVKALEFLGIRAEVRRHGIGSRQNLCYLREGSSDVLIGGRKISGSAQVRDGKAILQHGTLLLDFDAATWLSVIRNPGLTQDELVSRVTWLHEHVDTSAEAAAYAIVNGFSELLNESVLKSALDADEREMATKLYISKYSKSNWNVNGQAVS